MSITLGQINHTKSVTDKVTDFQPGSVVRTLMEASAVEIEQLYLQMFLGLRDAIPVSAYLSFGFGTLPAKVAHGYVSVSVATALGADLLIPAGTAFLNASGLRYLSASAVTWASGTTVVRIPVNAEAAGLAYNAAVGTITTSPFFDPSYTISNAKIANGSDVETDDERQTRFTEFVKSLSSGTVIAVTNAAKTASILDIDGNISECVTRVGLEEIVGSVSVYIYSSAGTPSTALITAAQLLMDGSRNDDLGTITPGARPAGVPVTVYAMAERSVPMAIQVKLLSGYTLTPAMQQSIGDLYTTAIAAILPGTTVYLNTVLDQLLAVTGVDYIVPVVAANITCAASEVLKAGALTITTL